MKNFNESELCKEQINNLEEDLQELLDKSAKILGYKSEDLEYLNKIVEDLLILNSKESNELAADIMDIEEDMIITEEYYDEVVEDNPFSNLYDEDQNSNN